VTLSLKTLQGHFTKLITSRTSDCIQPNVWHQSENDAWNSDLLSSRRNSGMVWTALTDDGRAFHARAAATGKARSPSVERRVKGTTSVDVEADRRRRRPPTSATCLQSHPRFKGVHHYSHGPISCSYRASMSTFTFSFQDRPLLLQSCPQFGQL